MPDDEKLKPGTDKLVKGFSEAETNRARRINSLTNKMNELVQKENQKRLQMSSEISSLTKQQQENMKTLNMEREDFTNQTTAGFNRVIKGLGDTISSLATGVKSITMDTAIASKNAVTQYGKAISEDISINKTNTIAMALSRATPLFGYFAAKFMETDVFRDAATKIREHVGSSVKRGLSAVGSLFRRSEEKERLELPAGGKIKQLQQGGIVTRGGVVEVHAAEVVAPVDKLIQQMALANAQVQKESMREMVKVFLEEYKVARQPTDVRWQDKLVRSLDELKIGMLGMASRFRIAMTRTLLKHPTFRAAIMGAQVLKSAFISPIKFIFGARGGYAGDVRQAMRTSNVTMKSANLLSLIYTKGQPRLDEISHYTRLTAQAATGDRFTEPGLRRPTTMFRKIKEFMTTRSIESKSAMLFRSLTSSLGLDPQALEEAGITKVSDFLRIGRIAKSAGITGRGILGKFRERPGQESKVEENIASTAKYAKEGTKKAERQRNKGINQRVAQNRKLTKIRKASEKGTRLLGRMGRRLKKMGGGLKTMFMSIFGFLGTIGRKLLGMFGSAGKFVSVLAPLLGKALLVGLAGAAGYIIGTIINKIVVNPIVKWFLNKIGAKVELSDIETAGITKKAHEFVVGGTAAEKRTGGAFIKESAMIQSMRERGAGGWGNIDLIQNAQKKYAADHINEYLKYSDHERRRIRMKFLESKAFRKKRPWPAENSEEYGISRETAFLKYLQTHGTPDIERTAMMSRGEIAEANARGRVAEKMALAGAFGKANEKLIVGQAANTAAVVQNTNLMTNANVNTANTVVGGGGGSVGGMGTASSGGISADKVAMSILDE